MTSETQSVDLDEMTAADFQFNVDRLRQEGWKLLTDSARAYVRGEKATEAMRSNVDLGLSRIKEAAHLAAYSEIKGGA